MTLKGLAQCYGGQEDRDLLKPDWWYNWGVGNLSDPNYVPMLRSGTPNVNLPANHNGYVLVFNEPTNPEPYGCHIPDYMNCLCRYAILTYAYPQAKFIVGGISSWKYAWLVSLHKWIVRCKLRLPAGYAIHGYANDYGTLTQMYTWWKTAHNQIKVITPASEFWVTETSDYRGNPATLKKILAKCTYYKFERVAVYTNRQPIGAGYACTSKVEMVNDNGLTRMGLAYTQS
jgi:hypothetical protein